MIENVTTALQVAATSGNGQTLVLPEPRFTTFRITGNGSVSAAAVSIECCPGSGPMIPGASSAGGMVWTVLTTITVPVGFAPCSRAP